MFSYKVKIMEDKIVMHIKNPKPKDRDGHPVKPLWYPNAISRKLIEFLNEYGEVEMVGLGPGSVNNMVKAICHAQRYLKREGKNLVADEFALKTVDLQQSDGSVLKGKAVSVEVQLVSASPE